MVMPRWDPLHRVTDGTSSGETDPGKDGGSVLHNPDRAGGVGAATGDWIPALTGVRGLAVVLVLAFHVGLPIPSGGLVGVTLFFVLSGYLITSLLIKEWAATGSIDLARFFARRARRLVPAQIVVVGIVTVVGVVSDRAVDAVQDALLSIAYVANWARAYGDPMGLLNHIWSLSIEAQFYVIWPLAFVLVARKRLLHGRAIVAIVIGLAAGSTVLRAVLEGGADSGRIYFGTDVRADALLAGCALALIGVRSRLIVAIRPFRPLALVAFAMVNLMPTLDPVWSD
ncbi:MAG: acyltransferase family protein, partial [Candidatus Limnocylindria bacterium]